MFYILYFSNYGLLGSMVRKNIDVGKWPIFFFEGNERHEKTS
jgi:hypothetical protein